MISGRETLQTIEQAIAQARNHETQLESVLRSTEESCARLRAERASSIAALARIRLDSMVQGEVVQHLDHAERRALDLVKDRTQQLKRQQAKRQALFDTVQKAETKRHGEAAHLEKALGALEAVRQAAAPRIRQSAAFQSQQSRIEEAIKIAEEAEKKARTAEQDREIKRKPYEADSLFMYLWQAKFGQREYTGGTVAKFFDGMIARMVGFADARANYAMLNEIPLRLRNHAESRRDHVSRERAALAQAETAGLAEVGGADLVQKVEAARQQLIAAEKDLSGLQQELADFESSIAAAAADPAYEEAIEILAEADSRQDIRELYRDAARTRTKEDDQIVQQIEANDHRLAKAEQEIEGIRREVREMARRRQEIEQERNHFRRRGYDNPYGGFADSHILSSILTGVLQGAIQGSILRDALRDNYSQRDSFWGTPTQMPQWNDTQASGGNWVPPWLDNGNNNSGGGWFQGNNGPSDSGSSYGGSSDSGSSGGGGGDGFSTGGGV